MPRIKEKCYTVQVPNRMAVRVRASKRPTGKTAKALANLFEACYKMLEKK